MKKGFYLLSVLTLFLIGCGSGSNSEKIVDTKISGSVEASYVKNILVCKKDSDICVKTDTLGRFNLPVNYPATLELKIGDNLLKTIYVNSNNIKITPAILSDNNITLAGYLGSFIHIATTGKINSTYCDVNNIKKLEINATGANLVEKIRDYVSKYNDLNFSVNNKNYVITAKDIDYYINSNPIKSGLYKIDYQGAVTIGDYAHFNLDFKNEKINYSFEGNVLDGVSGESDLINLYKNLFFISKDGNSFYFITRGVMVSKIVNSRGDFDVITIPKNYQKLRIDDVAKNYNLIVKELNIDGNTYNAFVFLNLLPDGNYSMIIKSLQNNDYFQINGTWILKNNRVTLFRENRKLAYLSIKVGYNKNTIVFDGINGGFGLGGEAIDITKSDLKTYHYLHITPESDNKTKVCFGYTTEKIIDNNKIEVTEKDEKCFIARSYPNKGVITFELVPVSSPRVYNETINPVITVNSQQVKLSGIAISDDSKISIFDGDNGIYLSVGEDGLTSASIGSDRSLY